MYNFLCSILKSSFITHSVREQIVSTIKLENSESTWITCSKLEMLILLYTHTNIKYVIYEHVLSILKNQNKLSEVKTSSIPY